MRNRLIYIFTLALLTIGITSTAVTAQNRPYRVSDRQMLALMDRIETKTDAYKREMDLALNRGRLSGSDSREMVQGYISDFENSTDRLKTNFDSRRSVSSDVSEVLNRAVFIDRFMTRNRLTTSAQTQWTNLKTDLNTLAANYNVSWSWNQTLPTYPGNTGNNYPVYTGSESQLRTLLARIETKTDSYKNIMVTALNRSRLDGRDSEDMINGYISDFENATDELKQNFDSRRSTSNDTTEVLNRAIFIDRFMTRNQLTVSSQTQWRSLKADLNTLANYYRLSWNWNQALPTYPVNTGNNYPGGNFPGRGFDARLTGTYRLNTAQSDNVVDVIAKSTGVYAANQRDNMNRNLERRLNSPERIAIEKSGDSVTLASTLSPQVTFDANGVAQTETTARGRTITVTASANNTSLILNYEGDRMNDFNVVFEPTRNGQLRVTRKIYLENRNEQITVSSVYDKVNNVAELTTVNDGSTYGGNYPTTGGSNTTNTDFYIPNGTRLQATLRNAINTRDSQVGDKFTMEVTSPSQYQGAIIEGRVGAADRSGRVSGRANVSLEFDTIRLRNGSTYRFAGFIDSVKAANGDNVTVNNEGTVRDSNQTTKTATRAGIGAALGALIGAIAGGGQGAAVGAVVGAGAGAGTVLVQGRDNIDLGQGSEFSITSSSPANVGYNRQ